jgi:hypothetical protein
MPRKVVVEVAGEIHVETEMAYLFFDGTKEVWIPKSQCSWDDDDKTMTMMEWMAIDKGLI